MPLLFAILTCALLLACRGSGGADDGAVILQPGDVPDGFRQTGQFQYYEGRSHLALYRRDTDQSMIMAGVVFRETDSPQRLDLEEMESLLDAYSDLLPQQADRETLNVETIGDSTLALQIRYSQPDTRQAMRMYQILFTQGQAVAAIGVSGPDGTWSLDDAVDLAKKQSRRLN